MTGGKFFFVRGCSFVYSYLGILFLLATRQLNITKWPQNLFVYLEIFICAQIKPSKWKIYLRANKFIWAQINLFLCRRGTHLCRRGTLLVGGSCRISHLRFSRFPRPLFAAASEDVFPPFWGSVDIIRSSRRVFAARHWLRGRVLVRWAFLFWWFWRWLVCECHRRFTVLWRTRRRFLLFLCREQCAAPSPPPSL